eukprot:scaffold2066_cov229-Ochromonas_danica.AAC.25
MSHEERHTVAQCPQLVSAEHCPHLPAAESDKTASVLQQSAIKRLNNFHWTALRGLSGQAGGGGGEAAEESAQAAHSQSLQRAVHQGIEAIVLVDVDEQRQVWQSLAEDQQVRQRVVQLTAQPQKTVTSPAEAFLFSRRAIQPRLFFFSQRNHEIEEVQGETQQTALPSSSAETDSPHSSHSSRTANRHQQACPAPRRPSAWRRGAAASDQSVAAAARPRDRRAGKGSLADSRDPDIRRALCSHLLHNNTPDLQVSSLL